MTQSTCAHGRCGQAAPIGSYCERHAKRRFTHGIKGYQDWHCRCDVCAAAKRRTRKGESPAYRRRKQLRRYGLTVEQFDELVTLQNGACAICGRVPHGRPLVVDHNHQTGDVRGLLCAPCNSALGLLGDGDEGLRNALRYISTREVRDDRA